MKIVLGLVVIAILGVGATANATIFKNLGRQNVRVEKVVVRDNHRANIRVEKVVVDHGRQRVVERVVNDHCYDNGAVAIERVVVKDINRNVEYVEVPHVRKVERIIIKERPQVKVVEKVVKQPVKEKVRVERVIVNGHGY